MSAVSSKDSSDGQSEPVTDLRNIAESEKPQALLAEPGWSLARLFPIIEWLPKYNYKRDFSVDVVAGLALAALVIPESMGYAALAGAKVQYGLYAALAAIIAYGIMGRTKLLIVGPATAVAALSASLVAGMSSQSDPQDLLAGLALASGLVLLVAGLLKQGWVMNFISKPVLDAFVVGLSITIIVSQSFKLLGIKKHDGSSVQQLWYLATHLGSMNGHAAIIGVTSIVLMLGLRKWKRRIPSAAIVVAFTMAAVGLTTFGSRVDLVGKVPSGLPAIDPPSLSASDIAPLLLGGVMLMFVGFSEGFAAANAAAQAKGQRVDSNIEIVDAGAANVASSIFGGIPVSGSLSKTEASLANGARTQMAALATGVVLLLTLLFFGPVFQYLPETTLAAVVITAVLGSARVMPVFRLWTLSRPDGVAAIATLVTVVVWDTLPAMVVGVVLSLLFLVRQVSFPSVFALGVNSSGEIAPVDTEDSELLAIPGVAIIRMEAPIIYANSGRLQTAVMNVVEDRNDLETLIIYGEQCSTIDVTGIDTLRDIDHSLAGRGIRLLLAGLNTDSLTSLERSGLDKEFKGRIFDRVIDEVRPGSPGHLGAVRVRFAPDPTVGETSTAEGGSTARKVQSAIDTSARVARSREKSARKQSRAAASKKSTAASGKKAPSAKKATPVKKAASQKTAAKKSAPKKAAPAKDAASADKAPAKKTTTQQKPSAKKVTKRTATKQSRGSRST